MVGRSYLHMPRAHLVDALSSGSPSTLAATLPFRAPICPAVLENVRVVSKTDMSDFRRRYKLEPLVRDETQVQDDGLDSRKRATVDDECPKCGNKGLEFYTMQASGGALVPNRAPICLARCSFRSCARRTRARQSSTSVQNAGTSIHRIRRPRKRRRGGRL